MDKYEKITSKIIILQKMRDACRQVSINEIFGGTTKRDDVYNAIVEVLEELEEQRELLLEEQEENAENAEFENLDD